MLSIVVSRWRTGLSASTFNTASQKMGYLTGRIDRESRRLLLLSSYIISSCLSCRIGKWLVRYCKHKVGKLLDELHFIIPVVVGL
jgi:hypothetical protein